MWVSRSRLSKCCMVFMGLFFVVDSDWRAVCSGFMNIDGMVKVLMDYWDGKRLIDLYDQTVASDSDASFDAIRLKDGQRVVLVACFTGEKIQSLDFGKIDAPVEDWEDVEIFDFAKRALLERCVVISLSCDSSSPAVMASAADPDSISYLESWLAS